MYKGFEIFNFTPLRDLEKTHVLDYTIVGREEQKRKKFSFEKTKNSFSAEFLLASLEEIYQLREFFRRHKGKLKAFWLKSYKRDYTLVQSAVSGSTQLVVKKSYLEYTFPFKRHIYIPSINFYAKIIGVSENTDSQVLYIDTPLPSQLDSSELIMDIYLVRFNTDALVFTFRASNIAYTKLSFVELQEETP